MDITRLSSKGQLADGTSYRARRKGASRSRSTLTSSYGCSRTITPRRQTAQFVLFRDNAVFVPKSVLLESE